MVGRPPFECRPLGWQLFVFLRFEQGIERLQTQSNLGESSKVISSYLDHYLPRATHDIIEQDAAWRDHFAKNFRLSSRSAVQVLPTTSNTVKGYETNGYEGIEQVVDKKYDLYLVDGPKGSPHYSRYDIVKLVQALNPGDQFIIIMDDVNRRGETETLQALKTGLEKKNITIQSGIYEGLKSVAILATSEYKFACSL